MRCWFLNPISKSFEISRSFLELPLLEALLSEYRLYPCLLLSYLVFLTPLRFRYHSQKGPINQNSFRFEDLETISQKLSNAPHETDYFTTL